MGDFLWHPEDVWHCSSIYQQHSAEYSCTQIYVYATHCGTAVRKGYILLKDRANAQKSEQDVGGERRSEQLAPWEHCLGMALCKGMRRYHQAAALRSAQPGGKCLRAGT